MDYTELERLVEIVQSSNIRSLTLRQGASRIVLRKQALTTGSALVASTQDSWEPDEPLAVDRQTVAAEMDAASNVVVSAPSVGIFHHVRPVVGLAAVVRAGQVIGQIEAIRLMSDVVSPADGDVIEVFVEDGMAVEYGQPLYELHVTGADEPLR